MLALQRSLLYFLVCQPSSNSQDQSNTNAQIRYRLPKFFQRDLSSSVNHTAHSVAPAPLP